MMLVPYKPLKFHIPEFSDVLIEFVEENGMRQITPAGVFVSKKRQLSVVRPRGQG